MGGSVRVGRAVCGALASGTLEEISSKGIRGWKRPTEVRASASGTLRVWDGSIKTLFVVLPESGTEGVSGKASL